MVENSHCGTINHLSYAPKTWLLITLYSYINPKHWNTKYVYIFHHESSPWFNFYRMCYHFSMQLTTSNWSTTVGCKHGNGLVTSRVNQTAGNLVTWFVYLIFNTFCLEENILLRFVYKYWYQTFIFQTRWNFALYLVVFQIVFTWPSVIFNGPEKYNQLGWTLVEPWVSFSPPSYDVWCAVCTQ